MAFSKRGEVSLTFHWMYVLIAGAVILLFFVGIALRQKAVAEKELSADVIRIMETIFAGAGVAEKTKNTIDASGLAEYTLYFDCAEGASEFGILGGEYRAQNAIDPLFAPAELKTHQLLTWSLPYKLPFKVIDFLFVSSPSISYHLFFLHNPVLKEFEEEMADLKNVFSYSTLGAFGSLDPQQWYHVRIVSDGALPLRLKGVPPRLQNLADEQVTLVELLGNRALYYQKSGDSWKSLGQAEVISLGEEKDPAAFAALFAGTPQQYQCNVKKALKRLTLLIGVYQEKVLALEDYYESKNEPRGACMSILSLNSLNPDDPLHSGNLKDSLEPLRDAAKTCPLTGNCLELTDFAKKVQYLNQQLELADCIPLY